MSSERSLIDALMTIDVEDEVTVNVADGLMAIAGAIHRLAAIHERAQERVASSAERFEAYVTAGGRAQ